jgi:hypothetical protein
VPEKIGFILLCGVRHATLSTGREKLPSAPDAFSRPTEATGVPMTTTTHHNSAEFRRGWDAALLAARNWHEGKAKQAIVQSKRTRFPKVLERESEVHRHSAEMMMTLNPDDV